MDKNTFGFMQKSYKTQDQKFIGNVKASRKALKQSNCAVIKAAFDRLYSYVCVYQGSYINTYFDYLSVIPILSLGLGIILGIGGSYYGIDNSFDGDVNNYSEIHENLPSNLSDHDNQVYLIPLRTTEGLNSPMK